MPNIRVMNWNIEQLSWNKINIAGGAMATALATTIHAQNVDIVVIVEVKTTHAEYIMGNLAAAISALDGNPWEWFLSYRTGGEHYGFLVRDLMLIRPLSFVSNPNVAPANVTDGTSTRPFNDLTKLRWNTWPNNAWGGLPAVLPVPRPRVGLTDAFASRARPRGPVRQRFAGGALATGGGYSLGRGFRLPCLAMFHVHTGAGDYILPIVCCHYAAVRGGRNFLAQQQVAQLSYLHIAQLFSFYDVLAPAAPEAGYLEVNGAAHLLREIVYTGDFNMDFMENDPAGADFVQRTNHNAYLNITPTLQAGGSAAPAAAPGAAPGGGAPAVPFAAFNPGPVTSNIPAQTLRAGLTTQGSIMLKYDAALAPANTAALRGAAFDNFIYGGTRLNTAVVNFGVGGADSADVIDVPADVVLPGAAANPQDLDLAAVWGHYNVTGTKNAAQAPNLNGGGALTVVDRWIGAKFLSDHLPVVLQFVCP